MCKECNVASGGAKSGSYYGAMGRHGAAISTGKGRRAPRLVALFNVCCAHLAVMGVSADPKLAKAKSK